MYFCILKKLQYNAHLFYTMNQYIVSQWFKYKRNLESFYINMVDALEQDMDGNIILFDPEEDIPDCEEEDDEDKWHSNVMFMCEDVIKKLLDHVINKGRNHPNLKLVDTTYTYIDGGCYDVFYALRDGEGHLWVITAFFGTYDSWTQLEKISKQRLLTLLMHLSLRMVQRLRRINECIYGSQIVLSNSTCNCAIHHLIDLQGLGSMDNPTRWDIRRTLSELPQKSIQPLFRLMSEKQSKYISLCLNAIIGDLEGYEDESSSTQQVSNTVKPIGGRLADTLIDRLIRFNLTGYCSICSVEPRGIGELHYFSEASYQKMKDYDSEFVGKSYFIAVGATLNDMMNDIDNNVHQLSN